MPMTSFDEVRFDFFKEAYERELTRRKEGLDRLSKLMTVYAIIGGIISFYMHNLPSLEVEWICLLFYSFFLIGAILGAIGFGKLISSIHRGVAYHLLSTPLEFDNAINSQVSNFAHIVEVDDKSVVAFKNALLIQYRDFSSKNQDSNDIREHRYNCVLNIASLSIVYILAAVIPHIFLSQNNDPRPTKVIIENPVKP